MEVIEIPLPLPLVSIGNDNLSKHIYKKIPVIFKCPDNIWKPRTTAVVSLKYLRTYLVPTYNGDGVSFSLGPEVSPVYANFASYFFFFFSSQAG